MMNDPLQRRYGYGAARLRIGLPIGSDSLAKTARMRIDHESSFAALPSLLCIGIALLLFAAAGIGPNESTLSDPFALAETRPNEMEFWSEVTTIETIAPVLPISRIPPIIKSEKKSNLAEAKNDPAALALAGDLAPRPQFDLALVAIRPLGELTPNNYTTPTPIGSIAGGRRPIAANVVTSRADPVITDLARRSTSPAPVPLAFALQAGVAKLNRSGVMRPAASESSFKGDAHPAWSPSAERQAFLAAGEALKNRGPIAPSVDRLPPVALARRSSASAKTIREAFGQVSRTTGGNAGWQEVPLDELPDCNPPGRQDMLKKRILLAAPDERQCSHRDGSYRFVETRNLGSFLMWSRSNPEHSTGHPVIRDACVALEKALRCLDESSTEESTQK